jgi:hypothetical protein
MPTRLGMAPPRFRDLGEFGPTLDAAAERLGISPTAIEKDYWVSEILQVLGRGFGDDFIWDSPRSVEAVTSSSPYGGGSPT